MIGNLMIEELVKEDRLVKNFHYCLILTIEEVVVFKV